jgi:cytidylate kinase
MNNKIIIAIDGLSSSGKSTIAKQLAKKMNYIYLDSGAMYRAITHFALQNQLISENHFNKEALIAYLPEIDIEFKHDHATNTSLVLMNGSNVTESIRLFKVSNFVSEIAKIYEIRVLVVKQQQKMGAQKGIVMDGRDIGSVVFPNAEVKFYVIASQEVRALRRYQELLKRGGKVTLEEVSESIRKRDDNDLNREHSPLVKTIDAIEIDSTHLNVQEQLAEVFDVVMDKITLQKEGR